MTLGHAPRQADLFRSTTSYCEGRVPADSIYALLHRECHQLFADELFGDLFTDVGRRSVPPLIVAVVMVLQRLEGLSDREAVERFSFDVRWKYAAGGLPFDHPSFAHTVLVDMRARLARSDRPERVFEIALGAAREAGLVGRRRVLDSTALYDAVATMDTVSLLRAGIRGVLAAAGERAETLRARLRRDDYAGGAKPAIDWEDSAAREALIDAIARDASALLAALEGEHLPPALGEAAALLTTLLGQDLETTLDGSFRIARRVAPDRIISTVDPEARHGHKTVHRSFDGYKGHLALDPDSEIVTATAVTPGNGSDALAAHRLLADDLAPAPQTEALAPLAVYADAAYGSGELLASLEAAGAELRVKVQPASSVGGRFSKADFAVDLDAGTVTCPAGQVARLRPRRHHREARFGAVCAGCPVRTACTSNPRGRSISVTRYEAALARARAARGDPAWLADYRATRPKIERRIAQLMRRRHGGRRVRVRGNPKVAADFSLLAAAVNLARLAVLGLFRAGPTWAVQPG